VWNALLHEVPVVHQGRTAAAPVFFVVGDGDGGLRAFGGPSTMGRPAAFLSAFHLSHAGVPAASITSARMVEDHLSSIVKDFFDPSSADTFNVQLQQ
jgi:hypothetical protein